MAVSHLYYNKATAYGSQLNSALQHLETGLEGLADQIASMQLMIDGNGTQAAHFAYVTAKYGFTDDATSKAAYEELLSLYSKLSGNGSVDNVNAAMLQAFAKLR